MEAIVLDLTKAQFLVDQAIKQRGEDFKYEKNGGSCQYVHAIKTYNEDTYSAEYDYENGKPGCLVGLALIKAGVPLSEFQWCNDEDSNSAINHLRREGYIKESSEEARHYLYNIQTSQDNGHAWGVAREAANRGKYLTAEGGEQEYDPDDYGYNSL
jgi:hypothetical protein